MDPNLRSALTHVAIAAQHLADELDPRQLCIGDADTLRQFSDWMQRTATAADARQITRALTAISPLLIYRNTPPELLRLPTCPPGVLAALLAVRAAFQALPLRGEVRVNTIEPTLIERLRETGKALENALAFVPSELQREILDKLDGRALTLDALEGELNVSRHTVLGNTDGRGGTQELQALGLIGNCRRQGGYFRPDAPPKKAH